MAITMANGFSSSCFSMDKIQDSTADIDRLLQDDNYSDFGSNSSSTSAPTQLEKEEDTCESCAVIESLRGLLRA